MTAIRHDLHRIRQDLQESLSLDKHPVALLIGAGCPSAVRVMGAGGADEPLIPAIAGLTSQITSALGGDTNFGKLKAQFHDDGRSAFTVEDLLSRVRNLARIVGKGEARGLDSSALSQLEKALCKQVVEAVRKALPHTDTAYHHLADWIGGVPRSRPVQLFTTNYDLLLEQALEDRSLPYFDGFVGARRPFFDLRAIEDDLIPARWSRLWKLHGCLSWALHSDGKITRTYRDDNSGDGLLIHPSELKYDQSRRMPYLAMIDRLKECIRQPSSLLITIGYGYGDDHLNEVVLQGLRSNPTAAAFGLLYQELAQEPAAETLSKRIPANLNLLARDRGVLRGVLGEWYVDPSSIPTTIPLANDLGDFAAFTTFLNSFAFRGSV